MKKKQDKNTLEITAIVLAVLMPLFGFILGIVAYCSEKEHKDLGLVAIILSVVFFVVWLCVLS